MAKFTTRMPSFNGVAAGNTATMDLPRGYTYHSLLIEHSAGDKTNNAEKHMIDEIRIRADGREIWGCAGDDLVDINEYEGMYNQDPDDVTDDIGNAARLVVPFDRQGLLRRDQRELTAIGTGNPQSETNPNPISTLVCEVDIRSGVANPALSALAVQSERSNLGLLKKRRKFNYSNVSAGNMEIADLPRGDFIDKIFIFCDKSADAASLPMLKGVTIKRNNTIIFERERADNLSIIDSYGLRDIVMTTKDRAASDDAFKKRRELYIIDSSEQGYGGDAFVSAVDDFRLILDLSTPVNMTVYVDYIGLINGN